MSAAPRLLASAPWGAARGLLPAELRAVGVGGLLAGVVELSLRPGLERIERLGGLGELTRGLALLAEPGVRSVVSGFGLPPARISRVGDTLVYRNGLDGATGELSPETSIAAQRALGAEWLIAPTLPERLVVNGRERVVPVDLAIEWLHRGAAVGLGERLLALLPVGSSEFRTHLAGAAVSLGFGGLASDGAPPEEPSGGLPLVVALGLPNLSALREAVRRGAQQIEVPFAMELAAAGQALTTSGPLVVHDRAGDEEPLDSGCDCPACRFSLGYLAHLVRAGETLAETLLLLHNLRTVVRLIGAPPAL